MKLNINRALVQKKTLRTGTNFYDFFYNYFYN